MSKYLSNSSGLTLLELLASLLLYTTITIFSFSLITKGIEHYENIKVSNAMRDEADFLIATLTKEIYTTKETQIESLPDKVSNKNYFLIKKDNSPPRKSGFENNQIVIEDSYIRPENKYISISSKSYIQKTDNSLYKVILVLTNKKNNQEKVFETQVKTINDREEE
ncbi:hypothetical protein NSQ95_11640 [Psychrobacillus sp. FSL W7-1457]|uniref:hypothetical protein n=1 Tax=Psychrobacillus sp. FSL W7-1457 TaxID=2954547 RepID=UPI003159B228